MTYYTTQQMLLSIGKWRNIAIYVKIFEKRQTARLFCQKNVLAFALSAKRKVNRAFSADF